MSTCTHSLTQTKETKIICQTHKHKSTEAGSPSACHAKWGITARIRGLPGENLMQHDGYLGTHEEEWSTFYCLSNMDTESQRRGHLFHDIDTNGIKNCRCQVVRLLDFGHNQIIFGEIRLLIVCQLSLPIGAEVSQGQHFYFQHQYSGKQHLCTQAWVGGF